MTQGEIESQQAALLVHAERQTKALESLRLRADLVLLLMLVAIVLSLGGVFR